MGKTTSPRPVNKRRGPASTGQRDLNSAVSARPAANNFSAWWAFGIDQAEAARGGVPLRLHINPATGFPPDSSLPRWRTRVRHGVLEFGPPYTAAFIRYLHRVGRRLPPSPFTDVMGRMFNPNGAQNHGFLVLAALLSGEVDSEIVRAQIGGCRLDYFRGAAVLALSYVWDAGQEQIANAVEPATPAGAA